jgi:hypothetical protein
MKLHATHVMERCIQRGHSWDEITPCLTHDLGDGWYEVDVDHPAYPRAQKHGTQKLKSGLGDMVAAGLSAIGVTKELVSKAVGGDCGCSKRQEQLNELGRKIGIG